MAPPQPPLTKVNHQVPAETMQSWLQCVTTVKRVSYEYKTCIIQGNSLLGVILYVFNCIFTLLRG